MDSLHEYLILWMHHKLSQRWVHGIGRDRVIEKRLKVSNNKTAKRVAKSDS